MTTHSSQPGNPRPKSAVTPSSIQHIQALFRKQSPDVVDQVELADIMELFETPDFKPDADLCRGLDIYYRSRTRQLIQMPENQAELVQFLDHLAYQESIPEFNRLQSPTGICYGTKWRCLGELIEDQVEVFAAVNPQKLLRRQHVETILKYLFDQQYRGGIPQQELMGQTSLTKSHLSSVLRALQEAGWVHKTSAGREKLVQITSKGITEAGFLDQQHHDLMDKVNDLERRLEEAARNDALMTREIREIKAAINSQSTAFASALANQAECAG